MQQPENDADLVFDATPSLKLFIDKDGRWFQNGMEIIHPQIYLHFNRCLEMAPEGCYQVRMGREICRVEVEDAPFVVRLLSEDGTGGLTVQLNDGTAEPFDPARFWMGPGNIPYTLVKGGAFRARFSRPAYHKLAAFIVGSEDETDFYLVINGARTPIRRLDQDAEDVSAR
jgi:hypothetical protein